MRFLLLYLFFLSAAFPSGAQVGAASPGRFWYALEEHPLLKQERALSPVRPKPRPSDNRTPEFFLSVGVLFLLGVMRQVFPRHIEGLYGLLAVLPAPRRQKPKAILPDGRASLGFHFLYALCLSYVLYAGWGLYAPDRVPDALPRFGLSALAVCAALLLGRFCSGLVAWVFGQQEREREYRQQTGPVTEFTGMLLFPLCLLMLLGQAGITAALWRIGALLLLLSVGVKVVRGSRVALQLWRTDNIHFLLYLCAFEFVPVGVMLKWASSLTG